MLSLARTSKYVTNTSVLSINKLEEDSYDRKDSTNLIVIVVINSYSCFLLYNIVSMQNQLLTACTYILINIERVSKHSVIILGLHMVTTCWSWAWTNRTSPSNGVGLGRPLAACSVYRDLTCSVHTVNNLWLFNCQWHAYLCIWGPYVRLAYMPNMLSYWNKVVIIIIIITTNFGWPAVQQVRDLCFYFLFSSSISLFSNNATRHDLPNRQSINQSSSNQSISQSVGQSVNQSVNKYRTFGKHGVYHHISWRATQLFMQ